MGSGNKMEIGEYGTRINPIEILVVGEIFMATFKSIYRVNEITPYQSSSSPFVTQLPS